MSDSEKKDKILTFLNIEDNRDGFFQFNDLNKLVFPDGSVNNNEILYLIDSVINDGYLFQDTSKVKYIFTITPFLKSGGYTGQEERRKLEAEASYQKTLYDAKLTKWQVKIFWPAFLFTLVGSILGIISFYLQVRK